MLSCCADTVIGTTSTAMEEAQGGCSCTASLPNGPESEQGLQDEETGFYNFSDKKRTRRAVGHCHLGDY